MPGGVRSEIRSEWHGEELAARVRQAGGRGARKAAERLRSLSVPRAPLQDSPLRQSATVTADEAKGLAAVSYDTPYAVKQHEELDYSHEEGEAKYLERPLNENRGQLLAIIAAEVRIVVSR